MGAEVKAEMLAVGEGADPDGLYAHCGDSRDCFSATGRGQ